MVVVAGISIATSIFERSIEETVTSYKLNFTGNTANRPKEVLFWRGSYQTRMHWLCPV